MLTAQAPAPVPPRAPVGYRRPVLWVVAGAIVLLVAVYVAVPQLVWLRAAVAPAFSDGSVVSLPAYGERGTYVLAYEHHSELSLQTTVTNRGPLPVTLTNIRLTDEPRPLVETTSVLAGGVALPVTLWPGQSTTIDLVGRFGNCRYYHERETQILDGLLVEAELAGRDFDRAVALDHDLVARSPMIVDCPDRTLPRGDDVRQ